MKRIPHIVVALLIIGLWISGVIPKQIGRIAATNYVQSNHRNLGLVFIRMDYSSAHGAYIAVFNGTNGSEYNFLMNSKLFPTNVMYDPINPPG